MSVPSALFANVIELSKIIKSAGSFPVLTGGPHSLVDPDSIMEVETIDYCLRGESDHTITPFLNYLLKGEGRIEDLNGLSYKDNNKIVHNNSLDLIKDLDSIPFPAINILNVDHYYHPFTKGKKYFSIITSRGCPFNCIFCFPMYKKQRRRSVENVISEIRETVEKYNILDFEFYDETFNLNPSWVMAFCEAVERLDLGIRWRARCRPELMTKEMALAMKKAGCYMISLGVESVNDQTLKWLNKRYTAEQVKAAVQVINSADIGLHGYFILGSPVESREQMMKTIDFSIKNDFDFVSFTILIPIPGTRLFDMAIEEGYIESYNKKDYSDQIGASKAVLKHPDMAKDEIQRLFKYAYIKFYLWPRNFNKLVKQIVTNRTMFFKIIRKFLKQYFS